MVVGFTLEEWVDDLLEGFVPDEVVLVVICVELLFFDEL